jgi:hypothetical protein
MQSLKVFTAFGAAAVKSYNQALVLKQHLSTAIKFARHWQTCARLEPGFSAQDIEFLQIL